MIDVNNMHFMYALNGYHTRLFSRTPQPIKLGVYIYKEYKEYHHIIRVYIYIL